MTEKLNPDDLAQFIARQLESGDRLEVDGKSLAAMLLGRKGGLRGGPARAAALTTERRSEIAKKAAAARWGGNGGKEKK